MTNEYGGKAQGLHLLKKYKMPVPQWTALTNDTAAHLSDEIINKIISQFGSCALLAVRSSATNEDGKTKSYAGVFESRLNVPAKLHSLKKAISEVIASADTI